MLIDMHLFVDLSAVIVFLRFYGLGQKITAVKNQGRGAGGGEH